MGQALKDSMQRSSHAKRVKLAQLALLLHLVMNVSLKGKASAKTATHAIELLAAPRKSSGLDTFQKSFEQEQI